MLFTCVINDIRRFQQICYFSQTFGNCSCVSSDNESGGTATIGFCDLNCKNWMTFLCLMALISLAVALQLTPGKFVVMRYTVGLFNSMNSPNTNEFSKNKYKLNRSKCSEINCLNCILHLHFTFKVQCESMARHLDFG